MAKLSIIIPSRHEPFLQHTISDLLAKATGDIEIIAVLDGFWPDPPLIDDPRVVVLHWGDVQGLRPSINAAAQVARGDFLLKIDAHCGVGPGFDEILTRDCADDWIVVPEKYSLNPVTWERFREPWQYFTFTFPYAPNTIPMGLHDKNCGPDVNLARAHLPIDDIITYQGSCWCLSKRLFQRIGPMDHEHYYMACEPEELGLKTWLSGGRVVVNKQTWYSHLHKGRSHKRGFPRFKHPWNSAIEWCCDYWMHNQWPDRVHDMKWLVEKFWPLLHGASDWAWPDDWEDPKWEQSRLHPDLG